MRPDIIASLEIFSAAIAYAAPFQVQDGELQRHRRRAVDYPVRYAADAPDPLRRLRKRGASPYSVVQVDGESSTAAPAPPPDTITVTQPASESSASTQSPLVTPVAPASTIDETIVITSTQELPAISTLMVTATPQAVAPHSSAIAAPSVIGAASASNPTSPASAEFTVDLSVATLITSTQTRTAEITSVVTNTMMDTVTATASASSTAYYDDGLWHTYYPVKTFEAPESTIATAVNARAAPSIVPSNYAVEVRSTQSNPYQNPATSVPSSASLSLDEYPGLVRHARRWITPSPVWDTSRLHSNVGRDNAISTPTPISHVSSGLAKRFDSGAAYVPHQERRAVITTEVRGVSAGSKRADGNLTRTEMNGLRRFKS